MFVLSCNAPSADCTSEMPSLALRSAIFMPRTCDSMRVEIARPAASSDAELMRLPLDRRSIAVSSDLFTAVADAEAISALMLVFTESAISRLLQAPSGVTAAIQLAAAPPQRAPATAEGDRACDRVRVGYRRIIFPTVARSFVVQLRAVSEQKACQRPWPETCLDGICDQVVV